MVPRSGYFIRFYTGVPKRSASPRRHVFWANKTRHFRKRNFARDSTLRKFLQRQPALTPPLFRLVQTQIGCDYFPVRADAAIPFGELSAGQAVEPAAVRRVGVVRGQ